MKFGFTIRTLFWAMSTITLVALGLAFATGRSAVAQDDNPNPASPEDGVRFELFQQILESNGKRDEGAAITTATPCVGGVAAGYPCENVDLMAFLPASSFGSSGGNDSWGWIDSLDGGEYALMGLNNGTAFVDISDPENPVYLGFLPTHTSSSTWRDIKVYNNYAFVVSEAGGHGMQIFDLTRLRSVASPPETFTEDAHYSGWSSAHNIVINEDTGYAFGVGTNTCSGGLHFVDISNPLSPVNAGCFSADGYTHDAQCVTYNGPDTEHVGSEICFAYNEDTLTIADVTNKGAPVQLSRSGYSGAGYTHQGWLTEDHAFALMDDELDELNNGHNTRTRVWDIADLESPVLIIVSDSTNTSSDHNQYVYQGVAYQANYASGLRIFDVSTLASTIESGGALNRLGYFDTNPSNDNAGFDGAWSTYPYFNSGTVIISDDSGLFIVKPTLDPTYSLTPTESSYGFCSGTPIVVDFDITGVAGYDGRVKLRANGSISPNRGTVPFQSTYMRSTTGRPAGQYPVKLRGRGQNAIPNAQAVTVIVSLYDAAPGAPNLISPADGATSVPTIATFEWSNPTQAQSFWLEVATDAGFSNVIYMAETQDTTHTTTDALPPDTELFWRVQAHNPCASGPWSATRSFTTQSQVCSAPALGIVDNATVTDSVTFATGETITDLDVYLDVSHTWVGDLQFSLEHVDTGTTVLLVDRPGRAGSGFGCSGDNMDVTVNDEGGDTAIENQCSDSPAISGDAPGGDPPGNILTAFDAEGFTGTWSLHVTDTESGDAGTLNLWCMNAQTAP